ncbi:MAG: response regulator transcription factor [Mariprofundaceae bacterium]
MSETIKVMIADDHDMVRVGIRRLIEDVSDIKVIAEVETGEEAVTKYEECNPDVVVMDLTMPGIGGLDAIKKISRSHKDAKVLALSFHENPVIPARALEFGALGYLAKGRKPAILIDAIRTVAAGERFIEPELAHRIVTEGLTDGTNLFQRLSPREFEVFTKLAEGYSTGTIADQLGLSIKTINNHQYSIHQKLNISNRAELTRLALGAQLVA